MLVLGHVKMKSGSLKISLDLSFYFECVLILANMSYSIKILLERGYMLYVGSYCGSLKVAWRTTGSKGSDNCACLLQRYMDCLEKKRVLMIGGFGYLLVLLDLLGSLLLGTGLGVVG